MKDDLNEIQTYRQSCATEFWQNIFRTEADYLAQCLSGCTEVLSVGCGPASVEGMLSARGFRVTGLDISAEALGSAPAGVRTVTASAEAMPFPSASFDAVIFVVSLQFIADYQKALAQTARVLRRGGRLIILLLNPSSTFFQERLTRPDSYVRQIRHRNLPEIERAVAGLFDMQTEYFLGIKGTTILECQDSSAALYVINGVRKENEA
jgi:ubiquinone/menaquinone biosynthesis C-methylase UbiE